MSTRVYQFGLRRPVRGEAHARGQMLAAARYRNDHVAIERGRRDAVRAAYAEDDAVRAAELALRQADSLPGADRSVVRPVALQALGRARKAAALRYAAELSRIEGLAADLRRAAREICGCYWGSYLLIERAADAVRRSMPLWDKDALSPNDPHFVAGVFTSGPDGLLTSGQGQIGVQLQGGLPTADAHGGRSRLVRVERVDDDRRHRMLWVRIGSDAREPIWGVWPIGHWHREIPDAAVWKWVCVSLRREGTREKWSCEITVEDPTPAPRSLDRRLAGVLAVSIEWTALPDGRMRVAQWVDDAGECGDVHLPARLVEGIRKADAIRSTRDKVLNDAKGRFVALLQGEPLSAPWLRSAAAAASVWRSPERFHSLAQRWRRERCDEARPAYDLLQAWELRDAHLHEYEASSRRQLLRQRRERYRVLAAQWGQRYRTLIMSDQNLSREARVPDEVMQSARQLCGVHELRMALRNVFLEDACPVDDSGRDTCVQLFERWRAALPAEGARVAQSVKDLAPTAGGAWARRKQRKAALLASGGIARDPSGNLPEE
jgi:hypothetical protein